MGVDDEASAPKLGERHRNDRLRAAIHEALEGCDRVAEIPAGPGMDVRGLRHIRRMIHLHDDPRPLAVHRRDNGRTGLPRPVFLSQLEAQSPFAALVAVGAATRAAGDGEGERNERGWYKPPMHSLLVGEKWPVRIAGAWMRA